MQSPINTIIRQSSRIPSERLNVLTAATHEAYESNLSKTNCNFYAVWSEGIKRWNTAYRPIPKNYHILPDNCIPDEIQFDLVLSQNKFGQIQFLKGIADALHLPLASIEHTLPTNDYLKANLTNIKQMRGDINIFISEYSRKEWGWEKDEAEVIHHGINTELFAPSGERKPVILSVVNDWINRGSICGFDLWQKITKGLPTVVLGDTPGLSKPAPSVDALVNTYQSSRVFLNTSLISPIPTSLLEAMSCGDAVISTSNCMIPEIIEHGVNGLISNNEKELRGYLELLLKDEKLAKELGENARKTIQSKFSLENFLDNWNSVFKRASNLVYTGENR